MLLNTGEELKNMDVLQNGRSICQWTTGDQERLPDHFLPDIVFIKIFVLTKLYSILILNCNKLNHLA